MDKAITTGSSVVQPATYGIRFNTRRSIDQIEQWLDAKCVGDWDLRLAGILEGSGLSKQIEIYFTNYADKELFRRTFLSKTPASSGSFGVALNWRRHRKSVDADLLRALLS